MRKFSLKTPTDREQINRNYIAILGALYFIAFVWVIVFKCNYDKMDAVVNMNRNRTLWTRVEAGFTSFPLKIILPFFTGKIDKPTHYMMYEGAIIPLLNILLYIPLGMVFKFFYNRPKAFALSVVLGGG